MDATSRPTADLDKARFVVEMVDPETPSVEPGRALRAARPDSKRIPALSRAIREARLDAIIAEEDKEPFRPYFADPVADFYRVWADTSPGSAMVVPGGRSWSRGEVASELRRRTAQGHELRQALYAGPTLAWLTRHAPAVPPGQRSFEPPPWVLVFLEDDIQFRTHFSEDVLRRLEVPWFDLASLHLGETPELPAEALAQGEPHRRILIVDERFEGSSRRGHDVAEELRAAVPEAECFVVSGESNDFDVYDIAKNPNVLSFLEKTEETERYHAGLDRLVHRFLFDDEGTALYRWSRSLADADIRNRARFAADQVLRRSPEGEEMRLAIRQAVLNELWTISHAPATESTVEELRSRWRRRLDP